MLICDTTKASKVC